MRICRRLLYVAKGSHRRQFSVLFSNSPRDGHWAGLKYTLQRHVGELFESSQRAAGHYDSDPAIAFTFH